MSILRESLIEYLLGIRQSGGELSFLVPAEVTAVIEIKIPSPRQWHLFEFTFGEVIPGTLQYAAMIDGAWNPSVFTITEASYLFRYLPPCPIFREWRQVVINTTNRTQRFEIFYRFNEYLRDTVEREMLKARMEIE